ncbi:MAG: LacI family DNA-binding transcriptional regulator [Devosiaceae bacterium]|nr:LacI family DNA-binding transcriptional regulator [Devosiaceae bacterium MH13]
MATMKDVARQAGVSVATVSAALSGKKFVSPELKARIHDVISEIDYRPSVVASNLRRGRTALLGLVIPDISNPFYTDFVAQVQRKAANKGMTVTLGISDQDADREAKLIDFMLNQKVEALLICSCDHDGVTRSALDGAARWSKLVLVDCVPEGVSADSVELDNYTAGRLATDHILAAGHRRVAAILGPENARSSVERYRGFRQSMLEAGLQPDPRLVEGGSFSIEGGYEAAKKLLALPSPPSAVFVANNLMLIGVMRAVSELGLDVPTALSLASIDDFPWASAFRPGITTVRQPTEEMADHAFDLAMARIDGDDGPFTRRVCMPDLIVRASCAQPASGVAGSI